MADTAHRGICSLSYGGKTLRFRTNPNSITWNHELITKVEDTYGGRVIQLLGTKLGDLEVTAECGWGGWPYMFKVTNFFQGLMHWQRKGDPARFYYSTRNWKLDVFATGIPFQDSVSSVSREFTMSFKIQEDVSGVMSQNTMSVALSKLKEGVGFQRGPYVNPGAYTGNSESGWWMNPTQMTGVNDLINQIPGAADAVNPLTSIFGLGGF